MQSLVEGVSNLAKIPIVRERDQPPDGTVEYDDGRQYNATKVRQITQAWVDEHMKEREAEFTEFVKGTVFCGTWNVNGKKQEGGLQEWLLPSCQDVADVYAVGFQEMVDLNAVNVALDSSKSQQRAQFWQESISECLESTGIRFVKVYEKFLVGLLLIVYVKESLAPHVKDIRGTSTGVGLMGMMGNKGGVSVRMMLYDSSLCFVCSHLAAHRDNVSARNADFRSIVERSVFAASDSIMCLGSSTDREVGSSSSLVTSSSVQSSLTSTDPSSSDVIRPRYGVAKSAGIDINILDHEIVFWMGDLNYRIEEGLSTEEVFHKAKGDWSQLREHDQLNIERAKKEVFQDFEEGILNFPPTYKYQPGTDHYAQKEGKKNRAPAWCDRILWRTTNSKDSIRLHSYKSASLNPSDHKPVSAFFSCDLRVVIAEKEMLVYSELMNKLEFWSNSSLPSVEISELQLEFENVKYEIPTTSIIKITNNGGAIVHWYFNPKLEESKHAKRWISIEKCSGLLLPQEVAEVAITVLVDKKTSQALNQAREELHDTLVLKIENSLEWYIGISAQFERSCYGMSLEQLIVLQQPVRTTICPPFKRSNRQSTPDSPTGSVDVFVNVEESDEFNRSRNSSGSKLSIPKELWRLIDALWTGGAIREKNLFSTDVNPQEVAAVRESLDCGTELPQCTPHAIVEALISFIAALSKPLLPSELCPNAEIDQSNLRLWCRRLLENLPPLHYNVFVYILSFLREVWANRDFNRITLERLSTVCVQAMTLPTSDPDVSNEERGKRLSKQQFLRPVIQYYISTSVL